MLTTALHFGYSINGLIASDSEAAMKLKCWLFGVTVLGLGGVNVWAEPLAIPTKRNRPGFYHRPIYTFPLESGRKLYHRGVRPDPCW